MSNQPNERLDGTQPGVAVLGCGHWGRNLVRNFAQLEALRAVFEPLESGRDDALQIAPKVDLARSVDEVLARPDIEGVVLATPAETHHSLALRAMAAGKDVLVEKPMAMTYRQGLEMQKMARERGRVLMVGHLLEYHPAVSKLRELAAQGALGRINYIYSNRLNFGKIRIEENALWSFAPHDIAVILRILGELPLEVTCVGGSYVTPNLADVTVSCLLFSSGVRAHVFVSWLNPFKEQKLVVVGDRLMAEFNDVAKEGKLVLYNQRVNLNERRPVLSKGDMEVVAIASDEPLRNECRHFLHCMRTRQEPLTDAESGLNVLRVLQACQVSLELNGRPTLLSDV